MDETSLLRDHAVAAGLMTASPDAVLLADDERRYVDANEAACVLLGRSRDEVLTLRVDDLAPEAARPWVADAWAQFRAEGAQAGTMVIARPDGSVRHVEFSARAAVAPGLHLSVLHDVTSRVEAELELRAANEALRLSVVEHRDRAERSEQRLLLALGDIPTVIWTQDVDLRFTYLSHYRWGLTPEQVLGHTDAEVWPGTSDEMLRLKREVLATGRQLETELTLAYPEGPRTVLLSIAPMLDEGGRPLGLLGASTDVTAIRQAERDASASAVLLEREVQERTRELATSERRMRELIEGVDAVIGRRIGGDRPFELSDRIRDLLGREPDKIPDFPAYEGLIHPDDLAACRATWDSATDAWTMEYRMRHADGRWVWVRDRARRVTREDGAASDLFFILSDVTALREAEARREAAVRASERLYRGLIEGQQAVFHDRSSADDGPVYISPQFEALTGYPAERWLEDPRFWRSLVHPADRARVHATFDESPGWTLEYRIVHASGRVVWVRDQTTSERGPDGDLLRESGLTIDITAERALEDRLREAEALYRGLIESQDAVFWEDELPGSRPLYLSPQIKRLFGYEPEPFVRGERVWLDVVHPEDRPRVAKAFDRAHEGTLEYRFLREDGSVAWLREHAVVLRDAGGRPVRRIGFGLDVTDLREAEEERLAYRERVSELARLESVARIAATTAHDFANILIGIDVFARSLEREDTLSEKGRGDIARIREAVRSGRSVTDTLVALGQRRPEAPSPVPLGRAIGQLAETARGLLGDAVALELELAEPDPTVEIDRTALERALVNLIANARDALPDGGRVRIATEVVEEDEATPTAVGVPTGGRYASITVGDDGVGMDEATKARVFEPYFTTKPTGQGTGLGLSSVHALVRASEGHIHLSSGPDAGTTFRICLPLD